MLRKRPGTAESERWPELPAAELTAFYRDRFRADVDWMGEVRSWKNYYRQVERLLRHSAPFDRLIFIGHGGFDGPILKEEAIRQERTLEGSNNRIVRAVELQPGLRHVLTFKYDIHLNPAFSAYVDSHWQSLLAMNDADIIRTLKLQEERTQPLDAACFARHCPPRQLDATENPRARAIKIKACEFACRDPLFVWRTYHDVAPKRFLKFAGTLRSLVKRDGLIFFGSCNPGSVATGEPEPWEEDALLIRSTLAGGPYESYVHLIAAAANRSVAGPIGKSSAKDIVDRIHLLENDRPQRYLCIVEPPSGKPSVH